MDYITVLTEKPQTFFVPGLDKTLLLYTLKKEADLLNVFQTIWSIFSLCLAVVLSRIRGNQT